jgi:hypothetical protein
MMWAAKSDESLFEKFPESRGKDIKVFEDTPLMSTSLTFCGPPEFQNWPASTQNSFIAYF